MATPRNLKKLGEALIAIVTSKKGGGRPGLINFMADKNLSPDDVIKVVSNPRLAIPELVKGTVVKAVLSPGVIKAAGVGPLKNFKAARDLAKTISDKKTRDILTDQIKTIRAAGQQATKAAGVAAGQKVRQARVAGVVTGRRTQARGFKKELDELKATTATQAVDQQESLKAARRFRPGGALALLAAGIAGGRLSKPGTTGQAQTDANNVILEELLSGGKVNRQPLVDQQTELAKVRTMLLIKKLMDLNAATADAGRIPFT